MGVDYHATPWKFEAKIGIRDLKSMALNPTPTRMKTLAYDIKSEQFSISDENGGKKLTFSKDQVCLLNANCPNGRNYLINLRDLGKELRIIELSPPRMNELHNFMLREVGVRKGSIKQAHSSSMNKSRDSNGAYKSTSMPRNESRESSSEKETMRKSSVWPSQPRFKDHTDPGYSLLASYADSNESTKRPLQRLKAPYQRSSVFQSSVQDSKEIPFTSPKVAPVNSFYSKRKAPIAPSSSFSTEFVSKRKKISNTSSENLPPSASTSNYNNVVDSVFERTFADYDFDRDIKCAIKQSLEMAPKVDEFNPLQHPGGWDELPLYLQRYDFWEKLPKMKGLRSGTLGEWVKGLDERLTIDGLLTLKTGEWLNADSIDAYLRYICTHMSLSDCRIEYIPTYAILSYANMGKLPTKWYWNLGEAQMILVPAHLKNSHWGMAVIDVASQRLTLMDSLNHRYTSEAKRKFMDTVTSILNDLVEQQELQTEFTEKFIAVENFDVPQQDNGTDCGIFSLLFATYGALKRPHDFSQKHVNWFRRKICYDLIRDIVAAAHMHQQDLYECTKIEEVKEEEEPEYGAAMKTEENQSVVEVKEEKEEPEYGTMKTETEENQSGESVLIL